MATLRLIGSLMVLFVFAGALNELESEALSGELANVKLDVFRMENENVAMNKMVTNHTKQFQADIIPKLISIDESLDHLEVNVRRLVQEHYERHVAFFAMGGKTDDPLRFQAMMFNDGNGYNLRTGVFFVPVTGVYIFTATLTVRGTLMGGNTNNASWLLIGTRFGPNVMMVPETLSPWNVQVYQAVMELWRGDVVCLEPFDGHSVYFNDVDDDGNFYNTFSGFLLF